MEVLLQEMKYPKENVQLRKRRAPTPVVTTSATSGKITPCKTADQGKKRLAKRRLIEQTSEHYGAEEAALDVELEKAKAFMKK